MTYIVAITSDQHANSTIALCPPEIRLDDGGFYRASKAQAWIWSGYEKFWQRAEELRKQYKAKLIAEWNRDLTEGDHHKTTQILSGNPVAQSKVVDAIMSIPLRLKVDHYLFIRGTPAHVGNDAACSEESAARGLKKDGWPVLLDEETGNASHWHYRMELEGVRLDFAHHGRVGTRPWTKPNVVANLAAEIFYDHCKSGVPYPHVAVRSHLHQYVDTHDQHPVRVIQTPAWQLATSFIHRIAPGKLADIGGVFLIIQKGTVMVEPMILHPEPTKLWRPAT